MKQGCILSSFFVVSVMAVRASMVVYGIVAVSFIYLIICIRNDRQWTGNFVGSVTMVTDDHHVRTVHDQKQQRK